MNKGGFRYWLERKSRHDPQFDRWTAWIARGLVILIAVIIVVQIWG